MQQFHSENSSASYDSLENEARMRAEVARRMEIEDAVRAESARRNDDSQLQMLSVGHLVVGILTALFSSFALLHFGMGLAMLLSPATFAEKGGGPPEFMGWMFTLLGGSVVLAGWTIGALGILASRNLRQRRGKRLIQVASGLQCLHMPLGTILGVFTFIVLERPSVRAQFGD